MRRSAAYGQSRRRARWPENSGEVDTSLLFDGLTDAPRALYCFSARLLTSYTGPLFRLRRTSDNAETDIDYVAGTNLCDETAITDFAFGTSAYAMTLYDQSGGGRDVTTATTTRQPLVYGGSITKIDSAVAAAYDVTDDELERGDALGLSGAIALSVWSVWTTATAAGQPGMFSIGTVAAGGLMEQYCESSNVKISLSIGGARRIFTSPNVNSGTNNTIARLAAGAGIGTSKMMHNAVELAEDSVVNGSNTLTLGTTYAAAVSGTRRGIPLNGKQGVLGFWNADLSAGDLAIVNAASLALYGV